MYGDNQQIMNAIKGIKTENRFTWLAFLLVAFIAMSSTRFWSFKGAPLNVFTLLESVNVLALLIIVFYNYRSPSFGKGTFSSNVALFIIIPLISIFPAALFHGQPYVQSLLALKVNFLWLLYFALHILQVPVRRLIQLMIFMGTVWILVTVVQQFTYPLAFFYTRTEETSADFLRAGVYRFMADDHHYGLFILIYYFYQFLLYKNARCLPPVLLGLVGFYYYGTRQFALAAIICLVVAALAQEGKVRYYAVLTMTIAGLVLVSLSSILFADYIEMTKEQVGSQEEDIRELSAEFYLYEYWPHWSATIFGNGYPHPDSDYGIETAYLNDPIGFYRSDVGIIGAFNTFGIFYILNILLANIKGIRKKYYTEETNYLRLFFFNALLLYIISEYYSYSSAIPYFCMLFYMADKAYESKKLEQQ